MSKKSETKTNNTQVVPGDKIAVIEEFLPAENCFEKDGSIIAEVTGEVIIDSKSHKIAVKPSKEHFSLRKDDIGFGKVEFVKKQVASVDIYKINNIDIAKPINSILHVSEASRRFVRNMYEVTRPGDWIRFRITRTDKPIYISFIGEGLGVVIAYCNQCGHGLNLFRRNFLKCPNCNFEQGRITSKFYGNPLNKP
ncbi:MAG: exosome complex RNA-binding protein Csl4 [Candidatus Hodarchaeales archaeon]